ncbi:response regulator [Geovibrio thiophilus]|uniref:Response regulator n=1 Tax=Geovibrio thiophilus TaxID=139438 RepID=A0A3R5V351_9BACT|nr:response regulator [Geovibrio thiophilus]QAR34375.1 response regulator [Geovibrio thiophilus]
MAYSVLVVDDESEIRLLYRTELEDSGYKVFEASNSAECFKILEKEKIDVILLDIKLKGESGIDILQEITRKYKTVKTILATAYSAYQDDFSTWLADGYWVKSPSDLESLLSEITTVIKKNKA